MLSTYATRSLKASTSRKSALCAAGMGRGCHVRPPSTVLRIVPPAPLAHATDDETALTPRSRAVTPLDCGSTRTAASAATRSTGNVRTRPGIAEPFRQNASALLRGYDVIHAHPL